MCDGGVSMRSDAFSVDELATLSARLLEDLKGMVGFVGFSVYKFLQPLYFNLYQFSQKHWR